MPQPKKKTSKSKRDSRRSHWKKLDLPNLNTCPNCKATKEAHHACLACGYYNGRQVLTIKEPSKKQKA